jgi:chemosensory pili system protein ChpA (sensor histidine kinase/response regulator)
MMSRDPKPNNPDNNFLDSEEIAQFLDSAEDSPNRTYSNDSFNDLGSLFDENFSRGLTSSMAQDDLPDRITFSDLPSDDEISEIFSENFSWQEKKPIQQEQSDWSDFPPSETQQPESLIVPDAISLEEELSSFFTPASESTSISDSSLLEAELTNFLSEESFQENLVEELTLDSDSLSLEAELASFLGEESFNSNVAQPTSNSTLEADDWDELKQLLASDETEAWQTVPSDFQSVTPQSQELDELEALLNQPSTDAPANGMLGTATPNDAVVFGELESMLLNEPTVPASAPPPNNKSLDNDFKDLENLLDDQFKDLENLLERAEGTKSTEPSEQQAPLGQRLQPRARIPKAKLFDQTMRVPVKQLDNLSNLIGELVVKRNALEDDEERLRQSLDNLLNQVQSLGEMGARMHDLYERTLLEGALLASRTQNRSFAGNGTSDRNGSQMSGGEVSYQIDQGLDALEMDRFTGFHLLSQEMIELIVRIRESTSDIQFLVDDTDQVTRNLRQVTTQLQEGMTKSRMVSFAQTADRLPRAIREVSLRLNKQAKLYVEGKDVLIDKMILEQLYNPMTHLVNNAIAHGIESPEERIKNGKPPEGRVTVRAFIQGNQTVITVSDDGAGINPERVKFKAIEKGLITQAQARALSKQEVYDFLFHPGFSTKDKADDFAGRGVGLDVVYTNLSEIRGTVSIDSAIGKGTTFTIRLPLTLSICKALCCESERSRMAFPIDGVEDTKDYLSSELIANEEGRKCVRWREMELPIYSLNDLLSYNRQNNRRSSYTNKAPEDTVSIVVLRSAGNLIGLQVDRVIGEQEIVIKQIEGPVPKSAGIAGATVLGDGSVMPIGDVLELIEIAQGRMRTDSTGNLWKKTYVPIQSDEGVKTEPTVLIVDDSITVRQLLSLSFGKAGYRVEQARDGQEALEKLQSGLPCDIVFCDIEMPRMNGLELLSHLQQDERFVSLPVALLTSRGAQRHRTVAAKLGASGYFTKPYTERDLLDAATRMLKGEVLLPGSTKISRVLTPEEEAPQLVSSQESHLATGKGSPSTQTKSENRVLIVDDSVMVREMLSMTFSKAGYKIEAARDGQEAWEKLRAGLSCDLILCDIEMPRMNGLELLSRLQEDEKLSAIPMAMITSRGAQKMQNLAAEKGAKGYFVKPYIEEVVLDAAKRLIAGEVLLKKGSTPEG